MRFGAPELLIALALLPLVALGYVAIQRRRHRYAVRFTNVDLLANLAPRTPGLRRHVPPALYLAAIGALVLALARPTMTIAVPREEATILLTMDVSGSMQATDVNPNRLEAARRAATDFIDQLPASIRVGLVAFSTTPRLLVAPTTDRAALRVAIDSLDADGGTALGDAIVTSLRAAGLAVDPPTGAGIDPFAPRTPDPVPPTPAPSSTAPWPGPSASTDPGQGGDAPLIAMVLLSDGANSAGRYEPLEAADQAATQGVPVYTIALGTDAGVVEVPDQFGELHRVDVPPDAETLAAIAERTGGRFFQAPTAKDLHAIYEGIGSRIGYTDEPREISQWFAAAGLAFMLVGGAFAAAWFNRLP